MLIQRKSLRVVHISQLVVLPPVVLLLALLALAVVRFKVLLERLVLAQRSIEPVLDVVVDSSRHMLLDLDPLVSEHLVQFHELEVLSDGPLLFVEVWIHVVIPPLTALLADSAWEEGSNLLPLLETVLCNLLFEDHVFLWGPVTFDLLNSAVFSVIPQNEPPIHALDFSLWLVEEILRVNGSFGFLLLNVLIKLLVNYVDVLYLVNGDKLNQIVILKYYKRVKNCWCVLTYLFFSPLLFFF